MRRILFTFFLSFGLLFSLSAQDHGHDHANGDDHSHEATSTHQDDDHGNHGDEAHGGDGEHGGGHHIASCKEFYSGGEAHHDFDPGATAFHHIADANVYSIGPWSIPLPCFLYAPGHGWDMFSSAKFGIGHHGTGHYAYQGYVLNEGSVNRVESNDFPREKVEIDAILPSERDGKVISLVCYNNQEYIALPKSTADGGLFGGGVTNFYDFSLTKNVVSMIIVFILLSWLFITVAKAYKTRDGKAPKGIQSLIEPVFLFIQDEVAKPFLGHKWEKFLPLLMSLFFFILGLNLFGQIPFLGGSNVTGNLAVTMVLAIIAFIVTNINGNKDYWEHILWMPGIPAWVKVVTTPVELLGVFIKPLTLMLRLFANITAGHMVVVIFVGLIFVFGESGANAGASYGTAIGSTLLTIFMMSIELLVAFIQAFVFTILTASYIGAAIEEHHH